MESQKSDFVVLPRTTIAELMAEGGPSYTRRPKTGEAAKSARKAGKSWTKDEHLAFLEGLRVCGRGNWIRIAREFVPTRTHTQIASHAQKHALRKSGETKRRSRFQEYEKKAKEECNGLQQVPSEAENLGETNLDERATPFEGPALDANGWQNHVVTESGSGQTKIYKPTASRRPLQLYSASFEDKSSSQAASS